MRPDGLMGVALQGPVGRGRPEQAGRAGAGHRAWQDLLPGCWASGSLPPGEQGQPPRSPAWALGLGCSRQPPAVRDVSLAGFDGEEDKRSENSVGPCNQDQR